MGSRAFPHSTSLGRVRELSSVRIAEMTSAHLSATLSLIEEMDLGLPVDTAWLRYRTIDDPSCAPALLLVAEAGDEVTGFCFGCVREELGVVKLFGVSSRHRREGIATSLFDTLESHLRGRAVREVIAGGVAPDHFVPGVDVRSTEAVSFLMQRGYETNRVTRVDMAVDLNEADLETSIEHDLQGAGILLRRARAAEVQAAADFALENFSENWRREVSHAARFVPLPLFVALRGEHIVGFAAYDVTGLARFGPTGVHPDYRRRGIGCALLRKCLCSIRDRGDALATIGWVGPIDYYARCVNARVYRTYWVFRKCLR
jgi:ribosomal protein S18 acetylase RimI-like enzyme